MPQLKVQNQYRATLTSSILATGDIAFTVTTPPTYTNGFIVLSPDVISQREVIYFYNVVGNTIYARYENRSSPKAHSSSEAVQINDVAEIFNAFSDMISQAFYVEKTGGLNVKVWGGYVLYNGNPVTVADTNLLLTDNTTNYIKYNFTTNTISVDTVNGGNIKAVVVTLAWVITSIVYRFSKESLIDFTVAITGALPSQSWHAGEALITDGNNVSWGVPSWVRNIGVGKGIDVDRVSGLEVFRTVSDVTAIESDDIFRMRDADGTYNDITGLALKADIIAGADPIGSIRFTTVSWSFGVGYTLVSTTTLSGTDAFTAKTSMGTARYGSYAWVIGSKMYVVGGDNAVSGSFQTNEEYDFILWTWSTKASITAWRSRAYHGVVWWKFYVIGWLSDISTWTSYQSSTFEYDPVANTWATKSSMASARWDGASGVYNGRIYIVWGVDNAWTALSSVQYFDTVSNTFTTWLATLPSARKTTYNHGVSIWNKLYVAGWQDSGWATQTSTYEYDFPWNTWATKAVLPWAVHTWHFEACTVDWEIRVISISWFNWSNNTAAVYEYSPIANTWTSRSASAPQRRWWAVWAYWNEIYYAGWYVAAISALFDKYTPLKNKYEYERIS